MLGDRKTYAHLLGFKRHFNGRMDEVSAYEEFDSQTNWKDLAQQLLQAGDQCIAFCEQFGPLEDIGVTLILMNFILHIQVYGDAGEYAGTEVISRDCSHTS